MQVAFIVRATLYTVQGGDTQQVTQTARHLEQLGVGVDIRLTHEDIDYRKYDLLHFFNIIRPADILCHIRNSHKPFVVSPLLIDYSAYDKHHRKGFAGFLFKMLPSDTIEYLKTLARYAMGRDKLMTKAYFWKGQQRSVKEVLGGAALVFPNSMMESEKLERDYHPPAGCIPVPNGLDTEIFSADGFMRKDKNLVLCVARIEGIKNQLNLIKALNNTRYRLLIIGDPAPGQINYYRECRRMAASNVEFIGHIPQKELVQYYRRAQVHILPSWFETCGLSSL
ncbi:MAG TPA: glycosyltransferase family 4 protein, partial [Puia sp.]|nr:glycosyltransferase family 4 protein [Puia sp.]